MSLSSSLHGVDASHLADCRGSRVYLSFFLAITTNVPRFDLRRDGHVQFPNRLPRRIGKRIFDLGKHEAPLDMLESIIRNQLSTCVSLLTHRMVCVEAKEKTSVPFEADVSFDVLTFLPTDLAGSEGLDGMEIVSIRPQVDPFVFPVCLRRVPSRTECWRNFIS